MNKHPSYSVLVNIYQLVLQGESPDLQHLLVSVGLIFLPEPTSSDRMVPLGVN